MRITIAGAEITDAVVDILDPLQNDPAIAREYIAVIDDITRATILDIDGADTGNDAAVLARLRVLQMLRRDIAVLAAPPDVDDPGNDIPAFEA